MKMRTLSLNAVLLLALLTPGVGQLTFAVPPKSPESAATVPPSAQSDASISAVLAGATSAAAGQLYACAVTTGGGLKCWGDNEYGQLGDGTTTDRHTPVDVVGLISDVVAVTAGHSHTCAVTTGGGVKCWGRGSYGQLGDGTPTYVSSTPVDVMGLTSGVVSVAAGGAHTCAVTTNGGVKCWGGNGSGQLGDGTTTDRYGPVDVAGLTSGVVVLTAGESHTCAVTSGGGVKCWGRNGHGRLGDGTTTDRWIPADVAGLASGVVAVTAGGAHTCAVTTNGGVKCWGWNGYGQLGDGSTIDRSAPVNVVGLTGGGATVEASWSHTCAVTLSGGVKCWGSNSDGKLGDGSTMNRSVPVGVVGLIGDGVSVAAGDYHSCAVVTGGGVMCWGWNLYGQLGDGTATHRTTPMQVLGLANGVLSAAAGDRHTCAVIIGGGAMCWGSNFAGQLGDGTQTDRGTAVDVAGLSSGVISMATGEYHTCALTTGGGVKCWGNNCLGQLGDGTTMDHLTPMDVVGMTSGVASVAAGYSHTCATTTKGGVKCWGSNYHGQLGDGTTTDRWMPVDVVGLTSGVLSVTTGSYHTCAVTTGGGVKCWGLNEFGELGDGTTTNRSAPVDVVGLISGVVSVEADYLHTCALTEDSGVKCWGDNMCGQLGDGTTTNRYVPVDVLGLTSGVQSVAAGGVHTCAVTAGGGAKCWGCNSYGGLGDGTTTDRSTPVDVAGLTNGVVSIAEGIFHTCALNTGGGLQCWGYDDCGQLGLGTIVHQLTPVGVVGFGAESHKVSGAIRYSDGAPIGSVTVTDGAGHTAVTNLAGYYELVGLAPKTYVITPTLSGYTFQPPTRTVTVPDPAPQDFVAAAIKPWLIMYYLAGDNDLDEGLRWLLDVLRQIEAPESFNIAIMHDGLLDGDTRYYYIAGNTSFVVKNELDVGDPQTLVEFADWARSMFPATHTMLVIADHGNLTGLADDYSQHSRIDTRELGDALRQITERQGRIDVVFLEICLGASLEFAYEIASYTDWVVASENILYGPTLPRYLESLDSSTDPESLAVSIAQSYIEENAREALPLTISVMRMSNIGQLDRAIDDLAVTLDEEMGGIANTWFRNKLLTEVQRFNSDGSGSLDRYDELIDLYDFARLAFVYGDTAVQSAANEVMTAIADSPTVEDRVVRFEAHRSDATYDLDSSHGISAFFPKPGFLRSFYEGTLISFAAGTNWNPNLQVSVVPGSSGPSALAVDPANHWGSMLVQYVNTAYPGAVDDPQPPPLLAPVFVPPVYRVYLPVTVRN